MPLYLQTAPEQGGLRYGPFSGVIQVGVDPRRCQLTLPPGEGLGPVQLTLALDGAAVQLSPAGPAWLQPKGQGPLWPIQGPLQAKVGDWVVLGSQQGPKLQLLAADPARPTPALAAGYPAPAGAGLPRPVGGGFADGVAREVGRVAQARLLTTSPFREVYAVWSRFRTGSLFSPQAVVAVVVALISAMAAGTFTCSGLAFAAWRALTW